MFRDRAVEICIKAAKPTLERIRQDRRRVPAQLQPILKHVEERLLDHELQVKSLRRELGLRDESLMQRFGEEIGLTPWAYISDCRLEVAARMLLNSDLKPWRIGTAVGYGSGDSFGRAFKRWCGQAPGKYRKQPRKKVVAEQLDEDLLSAEELRQALAGELALEQADVLTHRLEMVRDQLLAVYPGLRPELVEITEPAFGAEFVETSMAESLWKTVRGLPRPELQAAVRSQNAFSTPALFQVLSGKASDFENLDSERRLVLAELLPEVLEPIAPQLGRQLSNYKAVAWATLAEARADAGDGGGAAKALALADEALRVAGEDVHPGARFKVLVARAAVRQDEDDGVLNMLHEMTELVESLVEDES